MLSANTCHIDDRLSPPERVQLRGFAIIWHGWLCPTFIPVVISDMFVSFAIDPLANQNLGFAAGRIWGEYLWFRGSPASPWQWQSNFRPLDFFLWFLRRACVLGCFFWGGASHSNIPSNANCSARCATVLGRHKAFPFGGSSQGEKRCEFVGAGPSKVRHEFNVVFCLGSFVVNHLRNGDIHHIVKVDG